MGNATVLRLLRLLRLSRMSRMARLLRSVPELMILIRGIMTTASSVGFTASLIFLAMYIWALVIKQLGEGHPFQATFFTTIPEGMYTLMMTGCFMKGVDIQLNMMRKQSPVCAVAYFCFVVLSGITMMKILTGMLCKVIVAVSEAEHEKIHVSFLKDALLYVMVDIGCAEIPAHGQLDDIDVENIRITQEKFAQMILHGRALDALSRIGVDLEGLVAHARHVYGDQEDNKYELPFSTLLEVLLQLRGTNTATVRDIVGLKNFVDESFREVKNHITRQRQPSNPIAQVLDSDGGNGDKRLSDNATHLDDLARDTGDGDTLPPERPPEFSENGAAAYSKSTATAMEVFTNYMALELTDRSRFLSLLAGCGSERRGGVSSPSPVPP